jgi:hypothetical protein
MPAFRILEQSFDQLLVKTRITTGAGSGPASTVTEIFCLWTGREFSVVLHLIGGILPPRYSGYRMPPIRH